MLVVVDKFWNAVVVMLLCQVKLALCGSADVVMSAASCALPVEEEKRGEFSFRLVNKDRLSTLCYHESIMHQKVSLSSVLSCNSSLSTPMLLKDAVDRLILVLHEEHLHLSSSVGHCFRFHYAIALLLV